MKPPQFVSIENAPAWKQLRALHSAAKESPPQSLFAADPARFEKFSLTLDDLLLDFSKTSLTAEALASLYQLAQQAEVFARRDAMFAGDIVNHTESRAVLHTALRAEENATVVCGGENVMPEVAAVRREMLDYAEDCRAGKIAAADGKPFSDAVNIGIGGSDLGPAMAAAALRPYCDGLRTHFVSNMDGAHLADTLAELNPQRTLMVISSKTFTTAETMENGRRMAAWLAEGVGAENAPKHIVAITAAPELAEKFGARRVFRYWPWVGGRYSLWGAVGLPLALAIGRRHFLDFLRGGREMDSHFVSAPPENNLPLTLGLVGVWHRNFCGLPTRAILPYEQRLHLLPSYLQQLDMESNGKQTLQDGRTAAAATSPVVWGTAATNAQHAYFQMLHQGGDIVPCEFIAAARGSEGDGGRNGLVANCLAQSAALFFGGGEAGAKEPHRRFVGGRPSVTLLYRRLTPASLGRLLSLFEHRTFVEGAIWGVNSFDQWGVELGKTLATRLHQHIADLQSGESDSAPDQDSSTRGLLSHFSRLSDNG